MRTLKYVVLALVVVSIGFAALVRWLWPTPEDRLVATYQKRFDERKAQIERAIEALPSPGAGPVLHKAKLAEVRDTRIALVDYRALKDPAEVYPCRIKDPFAARLLYWQPGRLNKDPSTPWLGGVWPNHRDKLADAYEHFLASGSRYLVVVRPITWDEPDASQDPIKPGFVDLEVFVLDVARAEVLASTRFVYDQAEQRTITFDLRIGAQNQAEHNLRSRVHRRVHDWVAALFAADQDVTIGSLLYDLNDRLKAPEPPHRF
jgi:hypothetical protein